ncbi:pyridoxal phosphate-dependent aminotransferase, partial [Fusicatenibacter saccharivorans]|nr:pyridoxal phosphate-dependent aminotransferase [Fusicatenibacter saccharivorans]
ELSEYATSRGAEIGYQNVFDYSLGNPSVPAPKSFADAMIDLYENGDPVAIHGYSPSLGIPSFKQTVAANLNARFGWAYTGNN